MSKNHFTVQELRDLRDESDRKLRLLEIQSEQAKKSLWSQISAQDLTRKAVCRAQEMMKDVFEWDRVNNTGIITLHFISEVDALLSINAPVSLDCNRFHESCTFLRLEAYVNKVTRSEYGFCVVNLIKGFYSTEEEM